MLVDNFHIKYIAVHKKSLTTNIFVFVYVNKPQLEYICIFFENNIWPTLLLSMDSCLECVLYFFHISRSEQTPGNGFHPCDDSVTE